MSVMPCVCVKSKRGRDAISVIDGFEPAPVPSQAPIGFPNLLKGMNAGKSMT